MKLERGKYDYKIEDCGHVQDVLVHENGYYRPLVPVSFDEFVALRNRERGKADIWAKPVYSAWQAVTNLLFLYPAPDEDYTITVRYYPHMREA